MSWTVQTCRNPVDSECFRPIMLCSLSSAAAVVITGLIGYLCFRAKSARKWRIAVLILALMEALTIAIHYSLVDAFELALVVVFWQDMQFVFLAYVFYQQLFRLLRRSDLTKKYVLPITGSISVFIFGVTIFTIAESLTGRIQVGDCSDPHWVVLSSSGFIIGVVFLFAGRVIASRMKAVHMPSSIRAQRKRQLILLLAVYFFSATVGFVYDWTLFITHKLGRRCDDFTNVRSYDNYFVTFIRICYYIVPMYGVILFELFVLLRGEQLSEIGKRSFRSLSASESTALVGRA